MNRVKIDSSAIRELGHDATGTEVQYHRTGCARQSRPATVDGETRQAQCNCEGGDTYLHPGVPDEVYQTVTASPSVGKAFGVHIKNARHPHTKELLYPHVKREVTK